MPVLEIYDVNQPVLRQKAKKVARVTTAEQRILDDMLETMREANGIGLAAPQIGISQRLIVVELDETTYQLVNPEVTDASDETDVVREGCLSLPNYYGPVERPVRVTVRASDRDGRKVRIKASGMLSRALQHEIDHLDGVLFFDPQRMRSLSDLRYEPPQPDGEDVDGSPDEQSAKSGSIPVVVSAA
jgi:peptide deformylase